MTFLSKTILSLLDWFYKPFSNYLPRQTFNYAACGGVNTVFDILLYFITYNYILDKHIVHTGIVAISPHIAAFLFVFPITFTTGFLLSKYITFTESNLRGRVQLFRYGLTVVGSILLNYILLKLFVEVAGLYPTLSKILTTIIVVGYSYVCQKYFTFRIKIHPHES
ncbi:GtrA family protein [Carboxylicivirga mesophila]|uniref:GtrA family protein n=1 Tax=Carboxylicivirga mesophila TaxID=1166478 RepID=A0ABS5KCQ0_9BACT|nr:GtrA family protein [Carboxylicivirga mesophila]MBS2212602.1 GtrA family protein [Carboxylicivirga mesophila]